MSSILKISAIITAYNSEKYLMQAIDSVLAQTRPVDEILVIDDGSADQTAELAKQYGNQVQYIYQENQGAGAARNLGLANANGDLIAFLDADDIWLKEKTEKQEAYLLANPDVVLVSGQKIWLDEIKGEEWVMAYPQYSGKRFRRRLIVQNIVGNPSMTLIRKNAIERAGLLNPDLRWGQDWDWWIRLSVVGRIGFLPEPVIIYRWHSENISHLKREDRLACLENISNQAVDEYPSGVWRIVLRMLVRSRFLFEKAENLRKQISNPQKAVWMAFLALMLNPVDETKDKTSLLVRLVLGERKYKQLKVLFRGARSD